MQVPTPVCCELAAPPPHEAPHTRHRSGQRGCAAVVSPLTHHGTPGAFCVCTGRPFNLNNNRTLKIPGGRHAQTRKREGEHHVARTLYTPACCRSRMEVALVRVSRAGSPSEGQPSPPALCARDVCSVAARTGRGPRGWGCSRSHRTRSRTGRAPSRPCSPRRSRAW